VNSIILIPPVDSLSSSGDGFSYFQVAPILGESETVLLGEVAKFVPLSSNRFSSISTSASGAYVLAFGGAAGEVVTVTAAHAESGELKRFSGTAGADGKGIITVTPL